MAKLHGEAEGRDNSVLGHVIPRRRFTRWAFYYAVLYVVVPTLALGLVTDLLLYVVSTGLLGRCYALVCLLG